MREWQRADVESGDIRLAVFGYRTSGPEDNGDLEPGDRPVVVLVHGWPDSHHLWTHVAPLLAESFDVYAYDTRGYGDSDRPEEVDRYRLEHLAEDLFAVADAVSPGRPVHVIGHDWGSIQSWEAVTTPGAEARIASFVSVSGPNLGYATEWLETQLHPPTPSKVRDYLSQQFHLLYARFFRLPGISDALVPAALSEKRWTRFVALTERIDRSAIVLGPTFRRDARSGLRYYRANWGGGWTPQARPTSIPVLEIINTRDIALRPPVFSKTGDYATQLTRRVTPWGHWLPLAHPEYLAEAAREFIGSLTVPR